MRAAVEIAPNKFETREMGAPECGEAFCDTCGDCLHCYNDYCEGGCRWVIYAYYETPAPSRGEE